LIATFVVLREIGFEVKWVPMNKYVFLFKVAGKYFVCFSFEDGSLL
jgi:hypothetical protein